jgi:hypothetical protein
MEAILGFAILVFAIWLEWYLAKQFYIAAQAKGYNNSKYFWICFWLPFVGYLLVIALPDRGNTHQAISDELPDL